jgi:predicted nucleotidyltransferase
VRIHEICDIYILCTIAQEISMNTSTDVFLSARIPTELRTRLKVVAAQKGRNLQSLLTEIISQYVQQAEKKPPQAAEIIQKTRQLRSQLKSMKVSHLGLVGSVARGEARPDSDVDFLIEADHTHVFSLLNILEIKQFLSDQLGYEIDVAIRSKLKPDSAATMLKDEIVIF